jgi:hypothetical protein
MKTSTAIPTVLAKLGDRRTQMAILVVVFLTAAAFGPYLVGSLRTDQLATYALLVVLIPLNARRLQLAGTKSLLITWGVYLLVAIVASLPPAALGEEWPRGSLVAGLDNLALPVAVMLIVWTTVPRVSARSALFAVGRVLSIIVAANAVLALVSSQVVLTPVLRVFWSNAGIEWTTAQNAEFNGRYSGIFNHPAEAGVVYGVAGLLAIVVWQNRRVLTFILLGLILMGGVLTVSKVFLFGGIPLILLFWFLSLPSTRAARLGALAGLATLAGAAYFVARDWSGFSYLARLFVPTESEGTGGSASPFETIIDLYSSGRFTEGSQLLQVVNAVFSDHALWGVGAAGWQVPYDNGWIEALVVAGILGVVAYTATLAIILVIALRQPERRLRMFGIFLFLFLVGASLGIPALTVNRTSLVVWLVISLLALTALPAKSRSERGPSSFNGDNTATAADADATENVAS